MQKQNILNIETECAKTCRNVKRIKNKIRRHLCVLFFYIEFKKKHMQKELEE